MKKLRLSVSLVPILLSLNSCVTESETIYIVTPCPKLINLDKTYKEPQVEEFELEYEVLEK